jgi:hypothetical protein
MTLILNVEDTEIFVSKFGPVIIFPLPIREFLLVFKIHEFLDTILNMYISIFRRIVDVKHRKTNWAA